MAAAAIVYFLFALSTGDTPPDMTALAQYDTRAACNAAAQQVMDALETGKDGRLMLCVASDTLRDLAKKNGMPGAN